MTVLHKLNFTWHVEITVEKMMEQLLLLVLLVSNAFCVFQVGWSDNVKHPTGLTWDLWLVLAMFDVSMFDGEFAHIWMNKVLKEVV